MGSASDSTEFDAAVRQFVLARIVSRAGTIVSGLDRHRSKAVRYRSIRLEPNLEESIIGGDQRFFDIDPTWIDIDLRHFDIDPSRRDVARNSRRSIPNFREFSSC
jgi:hypothetical protein